MSRHTLRLLLLLLSFSLVLVACGDDAEVSDETTEETAGETSGENGEETSAEDGEAGADAAAVAPPGDTLSKIRITTNMGVIDLEINHTRAPVTTENFLSYVKSGHYSNTVFHRVIPKFMIQGGGYDTNYKEKPTLNEIINEADNGLSNERGTIAMARTNAPHSASSQFFINHKDNSIRLDHKDKTIRGWGYTVFGKVTKGMDVVDSIAETPTGRVDPFYTNAPLAPVVIESIVVITDEMEAAEAAEDAAAAEATDPGQTKQDEAAEAAAEDH